jgi:hypothetical protein
MKLMRTLTWLSVRNNFIIHCKHIPGVKNVIADALSRFNFQTFRAAEEHPTAMVLFNSKLFCSMVDMAVWCFSSALNV